MAVNVAVQRLQRLAVLGVGDARGVTQDPRNNVFVVGPNPETHASFNIHVWKRVFAYITNTLLRLSPVMGGTEEVLLKPLYEWGFHVGAVEVTAPPSSALMGSHRRR